MSKIPKISRQNSWFEKHR